MDNMTQFNEDLDFFSQFVSSDIQKYFMNGDESFPYNFDSILGNNVIPSQQVVNGMDNAFNGTPINNFNNNDNNNINNNANIQIDDLINNPYPNVYGHFNYNNNNANVYNNNNTYNNNNNNNTYNNDANTLLNNNGKRPHNDDDDDDDNNNKKDKKDKDYIPEEDSSDDDEEYEEEEVEEEGAIQILGDIPRKIQQQRQRQKNSASIPTVVVPSPQRNINGFQTPISRTYNRSIDGHDAPMPVNEEDATFRIPVGPITLVGAKLTMEQVKNTYSKSSVLKAMIPNRKSKVRTTFQFSNIDIIVDTKEMEQSIPEFNCNASKLLLKDFQLNYYPFGTFSGQNCGPSSNNITIDDSFLFNATKGFSLDEPKELDLHNGSHSENSIKLTYRYNEVGKVLDGIITCFGLKWASFHLMMSGTFDLQDKNGKTLWNRSFKSLIPVMRDDGTDDPDCAYYTSVTKPRNKQGYYKKLWTK